MSETKLDLNACRRFHLPEIGLTIAVLFVYLYVWKHQSPTNDAKQRDYGAVRLDDERNYYIHCADRVAVEGLSYLTTEDSLRSPPLPWLWLLLFGRSIVLTRAANIVAVIGASWLIASIVRDRWGRSQALMAFVLCALGYQVVLFSSTVLTEPLAFVFVCVAFWSAHRAESRNRLRYVILTGISTALAAYARPSLQLWPFALVGVYALWRLMRNVRKGGATPETTWTPRRVALMTIVHCAILAPWIVKNVMCFGVPRIANGFGAVFYLGSEFRTDGDEPIFSGMNWPNNRIQGPGGHMSLDGEQRLVAAAKANIREHPAAWIELAVRKAGRTLIGGPKWHFFPAATLRAKRQFEGRSKTLIEFVWWTGLGTIVTVCGIAGLFMRRRAGGFVFLIAIALVVYMTALHAATYALPRFAVPMWPAFVLGCAALAAQRPGRGAIVILTFGWMSIVAYLMLAYVWRPTCEVEASRAAYFTITADQKIKSAGVSTLSVSLDGHRPDYNTCIFVTARIAPIEGQPRVEATLRLTPADADGELGDDAAIGFPVLADDRDHTYLLCVELNRTWRDRKWGAVRLNIDAENPDRVRNLRIQIGH
ncbi:MAG: glycosyltransferase family 39 protein [Phycisphaerales bacterium]|nr:glycosyltransferase family 39 protein [Phycisphaerales bacterium]MCB9854910.1 glycosyltransferase family 39 protein [Phycisphaerales bacterium]MCB9864413.1 glycosyltransferase family 39 protein [Phycisphaerales bacterium]